MSLKQTVLPDYLYTLRAVNSPKSKDRVEIFSNEGKKLYSQDCRSNLTRDKIRDQAHILNKSGIKVTKNMVYLHNRPPFLTTSKRLQALHIYEHTSIIQLWLPFHLQVMNMFLEVFLNFCESYSWMTRGSQPPVQVFRVGWSQRPLKFLTRVGTSHLDLKDRETHGWQQLDLVIQMNFVPPAVWVQCYSHFA